MSLQDVARWTHLGWDTVKNIVKSDLARRYENVPLSGVRRIGVDENYLGKKAKYVTLVVDLESGQVLWVGKGRGKEALAGFWQRLRRSGTRNKDARHLVVESAQHIDFQHTLFIFHAAPLRRG